MADRRTSITSPPTSPSGFARLVSERQVALLVLAFAVMLQAVIGAMMFRPGELAGDDMSIHLAEISAIAAGLSAGELDLWNPSANGGFASGYFYQFLPQLVCAIFYLLVGWAVSLSMLFKFSIACALIALPITVYRALRLFHLPQVAAAAAGLGASTVFATSKWGTGLDSLFSTGLYTQAFAMAFYPLALAYAMRFLLRGKDLGRAVLYTLLTGFCHPFIAFAIAPAVVFIPWWKVGVADSLRRCATLLLWALLGSAPLWLPILVHYDAFGGFPERVAGEDGIPFRAFFADFKRGAYFDASRRAVTTVFVVLGLGAMLLRDGRTLLPIYLAGATFAALIMLGPVVGKTEGDLLPAVRFLGPMQVLLAAAGWAGVAIVVRAVLRASRRRLARSGVLACAGFAAAAAVGIAILVGLGVAKRASERVRTVESFPAVNNAEMRRVIEFLDTQPPGRVFAASEFGSGSHWWMYLPYVYNRQPAVRAYGGAALQSSPNFVFLRTADLFRVHGFFATRYLIARDDRVHGPRFQSAFEALEGQWDIIYHHGGYRIYAARDARLFRAVKPVGVVAGSRKQKTEEIGRWLKSMESDPDLALVEDASVGEVAAPTSVRFLETRQSRRSYGTTVEVDGDRPALVSLAVTFHPGWKVTIDGAPARVKRVSPAFLAVLVPTGKHDIRFEFSRPLWTWLLYALLLVGLALLIRRRRRQRAGDVAAAAVVSEDETGEREGLGRE